MKKRKPGTEKGGGSIICTASNAGLYPFPVAPLYGVSKAGVINLVRSLAKPLRGLDIQINALAPATVGSYLSFLTFHLSPKVFSLFLIRKLV